MLAAVAADPVLAPYADAIRGFARSSIRLWVDHHAVPSVGGSRAGGAPAAPAGFDWPTRVVEMPRPSQAWIEHQPFPPRLLPEDGSSRFEFVAQIDLAAVAPYDIDGLLPREGILLFFYDEFHTADIDPGGGFSPTSTRRMRNR